MSSETTWCGFFRPWMPVFPRDREGVGRRKASVCVLSASRDCPPIAWASAFLPAPNQPLLGRPLIFEVNSDPESLSGVICPISVLCSLEAESRLWTAGTSRVSDVYSLAAGVSSSWNSCPHFNFQFKLRSLENISPRVSFPKWHITLSMTATWSLTHHFLKNQSMRDVSWPLQSDWESLLRKTRILDFFVTFSVSSQPWIIIIYGVYLVPSM